MEAMNIERPILIILLQIEIKPERPHRLKQSMKT
ncbi:hypothetical protein Rleg4DRAFT_2295 [Rhizobium leguminosarum bv. trifolii WSM2297]|uniref:Uncharacterized protein n=1 Tax=Rhizobium leguminosarum bv. trifolii WSM2297 TaxID=754762 RepID=J0CM62_RHILT|nr:hypothetical protein Rleg4DRAFT_2295 [Rhizobium leguminosarum bv. trifolii WSM2297]